MLAAKLCLDGRSQARGLPRALRFEGLTAVFIERDGDRAILSPRRLPSIARLIDALSAFEAMPARSQPAQPDPREAF